MTTDLSNEYARLEALTLNIGGVPTSFGVYLGTKVAVFNLPNPASIGKQGAPAFDMGAPSQNWAELLATSIAERFERPDALREIVACAFGQEHGGAAKVEFTSSWRFRDQGRTFADAVQLKQSDEVDVVKRLLLMNTGSPDMMYGQQLLQEIDPQTVLMGQVSQKGFNGVLVIGDVQLDLKQSPDLELIQNEAKYDPLPTNKFWIRIGSAHVTLTASRAQAIRDAATAMLSANELAKLRAGAIRWGDPGTLQIAALLTKASEQRDAITSSASSSETTTPVTHAKYPKESKGLLERGRQFAEDVHHIKVMIELVEKVSQVVTSAGPAILLAIAAPNMATGAVAATAIGHAILTSEHPRPRE